MDTNNKTCVNCQSVCYDNIRQYYCTISNLPVEISGACELFQERAEPVAKNKNYLLYIMIFVTFCIIAFARYASRVESNKESDEFLENIIAEQKRQIGFYKYVEGIDTLGLKRYKGAYYTYDTACPKERFANVIPEYFFKLPESVNKNDSILLENILVVINPDSSMTVKYKLKGYLIRNDNVRKYEKIE